MLSRARTLIGIYFINAKFWWVVVTSWIQPTHVDNTLILDHALLVAIILVGYDIDWACLIAKQIHEVALKRFATILFPFLIYHLNIATGVEIFHHLDTLLEVQRTLVTSLIKANENLVAL